MPSYSGVWTLPAQYQAKGLGNWPVPPLTGALAYVFAGGINVTVSVQYFNIPSGGVTTDFGQKYYNDTYGYSFGALSNTIYGLLTSHLNPPGNRDKIEYITFATLGSKAAWGSLTQAMALASACSNSTRGLVAADAFTGPVYNLINYVTLASTGNASSFGQLSKDGPQQGSALASTTRAVFAIGYDNSAGPPEYATSSMQYVTIASTGNSVSFGGLTIARRYAGSTGSATRGLMMGGYNNDTFAQSRIDYITIATTGNSTNFGNLSSSRSPTATSDSIKAVAVGDYSGNTNVIDYVTIASTGNATNYGTLAVFKDGAACSNSHGGL
jgi:hypothetical protein